jgi:Fur family ferric uptake transcriptional regulator
MTAADDQLRTVLKTHGYSLTAARIAVYSLLRDKGPVTMAVLSAQCRHINRASVYRTIQLFERLGIVHRLQIGWKYKLELSDAFVAHHHHFVCNRCSNIIKLPEDSHIEDRLAALVKSQGLTMDNHTIEVSGICSSCKTR